MHTLSFITPWVNSTDMAPHVKGIIENYSYRIRPNYHTVHLGFSKLLGTLICGKICFYLLRIHYKKDMKKTYLMMIMRFFDFLYKGICCGYSSELHRQVDAIHMSTHNICLYKEVDKKYTGCNLKTMELLDCALIGLCVVIRSNTVFLNYNRMCRLL